MLVLITGVPGHGKTLRAVGHIRKHLAEGRKVFADIDGLMLPGVDPAPRDWRDTPEGSVVVYDEAQRIFGSDGRGGGRSDREDIRAFETHRHTGHDIYLITQHPNLIHSHVRRLIGRHEHVSRIFGRNCANVRWLDRCWEVDKPSAKRDANTELWTYPKADFGVYKSATIHTNTRRLPRGVKWALFGVLVLAGGVVYSFSTSGMFFGERPSLVPVSTSSVSVDRSPKSSPAIVPADSATSEIPWIDQDWAANGTVTPVGGCIATPTRCRCFNVDGEPLKLKSTECQRRVREPLPYAVDLRPSSREERRYPPAPASEAQRSAGPADSYYSREVWNEVQS